MSTTITDSPAVAGVPTRPPRGLPAAWSFLAKRLGFYLLTAVFAVTLNFAIPRFMPGDPVSTMIKQITQQTGAPPSASTIVELRAIYGNPTKGLLGQYLTYLDHLAHFDLGVSSTQYPTPVSHLILVALPWTLSLVTVTTVLAWVIGTLLGAWVGSHPGGRVDEWITSGSTFVNAVPTFWLGMLCLGVFSFMLHWFPSAGGYDPNVPYDVNNVWFWLSTLRYGALPAFTLVVIGFSGWLFSMRNVMVTTVSEDYVQLARAKGLPRRTVLFRYAARNALLPNVTGLAHAIGSVIGGVVLVETTFTYPGMGYLLEQAVTTHDFPVMQAIFIMITLAVLVSNFVADSLYVLLDPRTREEDA